MYGRFPREIFELPDGRDAPWENRTRNQRLGPNSSREIGCRSVPDLHVNGEAANPVEPGHPWQVPFQAQQSTLPKSTI